MTAVETILSDYEAGRLTRRERVVALAQLTTPETVNDVFARIPPDVARELLTWARGAPLKGGVMIGGELSPGTERRLAEQYRLAARAIQNWEERSSTHGGAPSGQPAPADNPLKALPSDFRLSSEDLRSLQTLPLYVTHGLLHCVRETLSAPSVIYHGLNRGEKAPVQLRYGWAICGKPRRAYDNAGSASVPPSDMVYVVYADAEGYIFDWDWVLEDNRCPGYPLDVALRFGNPLKQTRQLSFDVPGQLKAARFDATKPAPSSKGDCVFFYLRDDPSYAGRINEDLTVFYSLSARELITGFKIKNVQRILQEAHALSLSDAPGLNVLVLPILRKTHLLHPDVTMEIYELIIKAYLNAIKVPMPKPEECEPLDCVNG